MVRDDGGNCEGLNGGYTPSGTAMRRPTVLSSKAGIAQQPTVAVAAPQAAGLLLLLDSM